MQSAFDPYREWLDIADATETPNHYRMLGLRLFEDDPKQVARAVSRIRKVLMPHLSGPHRAEAKRLLSEIDLAQGCLSSPAAKRQYDELLRAELLNEPLVLPKSGFVQQHETGPLLPPGQFSPSATPLRSAFQPGPTVVPPMPPNAVKGRHSGASSGGTGPTANAEPVMRVKVEQTPAPLSPPQATVFEAPPPLPPSAFAGASPTGVPPAGNEADDMLPPAAMPVPTAAAPAQAQVMPAAYAIPMAAPAGYPQAPYAQPLHAQPIYPSTPIAPMAVPLTSSSLAGSADGSPFGAPVAYAAPAATPLVAGVPTSMEAPVVAAPRRTGPARSTSPTAIYIALPLIAVVVLVVVLLSNWQTGPNGEATDQIAQNQNASPPPQSDTSLPQPPPRHVEPEARATGREGDNRVSGDDSIRNPAAMKPAMPGNTAMPAVVQPPPPTATIAKPETPPASDPKTDDMIRQTLAEARQALSDRKFDLAKVKIEAARKSNGSSAVASEVQRVDALAQYVEGFWQGVDEQIKGLVVGDQTMLRDKTVGVVDVDAEKLILRVDGENRTYARDDLPIGVAIGLAEAWFNPNDPASKIFLGAIHLVHPKGDRDKARELWQQAAAGGKAQEVQLVLPELDVPAPQVAAMQQDDSANRKPKASELSAALTEVRQMFEADLAEATDGSAKAATAQKMYQRADQGGDTAEVRFALLSEAATLAARGGDFAQMSTALTRQAELFAIDAIEARTDTLFEAAKGLEGAEANQALAEAALATYDEAVLLEQFDQASKLVRTALGAARKSGNGELIKECSAREKEARELNKK